MNDRENAEQPLNDRSRYGTARFMAVLMASLGWLLLLLGLAGSAVALWLGENVEVVVVGVLASLFSLFLVVAGQLMRAVLDNADQTRQILKLLQTGPLQWATRPRPPDDPPAPPARSPEQAAWLKSPSSPISSDMLSTIASEHASTCVNPFCARLLPERNAVCPHCKTRQK